MKRLALFSFSILLLYLPMSAFAVICADLDSDDKIKKFLRKTKESNPFQRSKISVQLSISPCEGIICLKKHKKDRRKKTSLVHYIRIDKNKRVFSMKGENFPQCIVRKGERQFKCSECSSKVNDQCRSFKSSEKSNTIRGTNIDLADFDALYDMHHTNVCQEILKQPKYLKIIATKKSGNSPYERIVSYYERKREITVRINYYAQGVLRKIYRFFPKRFINFDGEWMSTVTRVRTVQGSEKRYIFETLVKVSKDRKKKYKLFLDPKSDPAISNANFKVLFATN